ncbi:hypothetical protein WR25_11229 isoform B [Diploscapter pachys]|nr:hypothetical protein WR25_11229 isoform B [Diploscapter pachys]
MAKLLEQDAQAQNQLREGRISEEDYVQKMALRKNEIEHIRKKLEELETQRSDMSIAKVDLETVEVMEKGNRALKRTTKFLKTNVEKVINDADKNAERLEEIGANFDQCRLSEDESLNRELDALLNGNEEPVAQVDGEAPMLPEVPTHTPAPTTEFFVPLEAPMLPEVPTHALANANADENEHPIGVAVDTDEY